MNSDLLGWWLCERQLPSGGLNGRPEKVLSVVTLYAIAWVHGFSRVVLRSLERTLSLIDSEFFSALGHVQMIYFYHNMLKSSTGVGGGPTFSVTALPGRHRQEI